MCLQDKAIGRRSYPKQTAITVPGSAGLVVAANPNRLAFSLVPLGGNETVFLTVGLDSSLRWFCFAKGEVSSTALLRVDDWGLLVTGDIYALNGTGIAVAAVVTEILADHTLDVAINKVV